MDEFKPTFNFIIPIIRLVYFIFFLALSILMIYQLFVLIIKGQFKFSSFVSSIIGLNLFFTLFYISFKAFLTQTKNFVFSNKGIKQINYLNLSEKHIKREDVLGYSTSDVPYKVKTFKQIIIYLKNNKKIEITQFCFLDFRFIEVALMHNGYHYFGFEPHRWKWFDSRYYQFEETSS